MLLLGWESLWGSDLSLGQAKAPLSQESPLLWPRSLRRCTGKDLQCCRLHQEGMLHTRAVVLSWVGDGWSSAADAAKLLSWEIWAFFGEQ